MKKQPTLELTDNGIDIVMDGSDVGYIDPYAGEFMVHIYADCIVNFIDGRNDCVAESKGLKDVINRMLGTVD